MWRAFFTGILLFMANCTMASPIVIAHRGASGYLPEHTLEAKAMAHAMNADFIEQDVVLSADGVPLVLHDIHLETTTDVEQRFPTRARQDGRYYAIDFTLAEIRQLRAHERSKRDASGREVAVYEERFPLQAGDFRVHTLADEIALIKGLNKSRGRNTGLYIELKSPVWHQQQGQDIARRVLDVLVETGYADKTQEVYLQCFNDNTLRYLRNELKTPLPLIQLIGENAWGEDGTVDYDYLRTQEGLEEIATYADGIGPWLHHIYRGRSATGDVRLSSLVEMAHANGLLVHPYTLRKEELPQGFDSFEQWLALFTDGAGVDGLFTDFPDLMVQFLQKTSPLAQQDTTRHYPQPDNP